MLACSVNTETCGWKEISLRRDGGDKREKWLKTVGESTWVKNVDMFISGSSGDFKADNNLIANVFQVSFSNYLCCLLEEYSQIIYTPRWAQFKALSFLTMQQSQASACSSSLDFYCLCSFVFPRLSYNWNHAICRLFRLAPFT